MRKYIGIDIGGTAIKAGVIDNNGQVIYKITKQANINHYEIPFIDIIKQTAKEIRTYASDNGMTIHGIGVSAAGQIDNRSGIVIGSCGNIPNWTGTKLKDEIQKIMYNPIKIENDANCAALAEHWIGNGKQYKKYDCLYHWYWHWWWHHNKWKAIVR